MIILKNSKCFNDPFGFGNSIGFKVLTNGNQIDRLMEVPLSKVKVFGILETEFAPRKQKQIQKIIKCLSEI